MGRDLFTRGTPYCRSMQLREAAAIEQELKTMRPNHQCPKVSRCCELAMLVGSEFVLLQHAMMGMSGLSYYEDHYGDKVVTTYAFLHEMFRAYVSHGHSYPVFPQRVDKGH